MSEWTPSRHHQSTRATSRPSTTIPMEYGGTDGRSEMDSDRRFARLIDKLANERFASAGLNLRFRNGELG